MTPQDERLVADALARHKAEHGRQAFVTCQDDGCKAAQMVKESAMCYPAPQFDPWFVEETVEGAQ